MEDFNINVGLMEDKSDTEFIGIVKSCLLPPPRLWKHWLNSLTEHLVLFRSILRWWPGRGREGYVPRGEGVSHCDLWLQKGGCGHVGWLWWHLWLL